MNRKVLDFDASVVDPEIAARCREILESFMLEDVQEVSPALGSFYVWVNDTNLHLLVHVYMNNEMYYC